MIEGLFRRSVTVASLPGIRRVELVKRNLLTVEERLNDRRRLSIARPKDDRKRKQHVEVLKRFIAISSFVRQSRQALRYGLLPPSSLRRNSATMKIAPTDTPAM